MLKSVLLAALLAAAPKKRGPDEDAPTIVHTPVKSAPLGKDLKFETEIIDASGVFEPLISWRKVGEDKWHVLRLREGGGNAFYGILLSIDVSENIEYFVEAYDQQGNGPARMGSPSSPLTIEVQKATVVAKLPPPPPPPPPPSGPSGPGFFAKYGPHVTIGAGGALLIAGAAMWFGASSTVGDLETKYPGGFSMQPSDREIAQGAVTQSQIGSTLMILGVLAGGGGTAWLFMRQAPGGAALHLTVRF